MHSFYFKNFILGAGLVMLSFIVLCASFIGIGRSITVRERTENIEKNATELSRLVSAYSHSGDIDDWNLRITMSSIAQITGNSCFICSPEGVVLSCSDMDFGCGHVGRRLSDSVMEALRRGGEYTALGTLDGFYDVQYYIAGEPIVGDDSRVLGYVFAASSAALTLRVWKSLMDVFLASALAILFLTLILSYITSRQQAKPINEMAAAALKFAHGDFSARVPEDRSDEIGALAASFNQMADSLEKSEKRRSDFLANVAHELKTPMTTISGFADGILDGTVPPEQQRRYLETISSETKRLNRLVRRMLDVTRVQNAGVEELRSKSFDAAELLARTLIVFEKKINDKHLEVNAMLPEESVIVLGDADAINQVIYNLLENAIKFAPQGTELGVSLFKQGGKAYISVKNRGETIPENELKLIFDRFHKTDKSRSMDRDGVGLGLYIVKSILNNHGEDIAVTSRDGVTEFVFSLTLK